ncbi:MAG: DNRLRE domain-containing protein [Phycisphaerales bacterium]|nr:DNRLRE domain-containing protein [Phycisphaerales bacterium]
MLCGTAQADSLIVTSNRDNTLYEDSGGFLSNGSGTGFFAGTTSSMQIRRGLVRFDVSAIPTGSTIAGVSMRLRMNRTIAGAQIVSLRRVTADWGEGISDAGDPGGGGSAAEPGDATWIHTFYDTQFWTNSGGDFSGVVSASTNVAGTGFYTWNGAGMVADVQSWVSGANTNYGWILIGNETAAGTTKRFASHEAPAESDWPLLTIEYTPPQYAVGDMNCDGRVDNFDIDPFVTALTDPDGYAAQYPNCDPLNADINQDGVVNNFDIDPFVALLTGG